MAVLTLADKLEQVALYLKSMLIVNCPKDTTNLSRNILLQYVSKDKIRIVIGNENADYAVFTNEPWISDKWNGKKNPNEGWVNKTIMEAQLMIQQLMSGEIPEEEFKQKIEELNKKYDEQIQEKVDEINYELANYK